MSFSIKERMGLVLKAFDTWQGWPMDFRAESEEEWTRDYAIIIVDIEEPDDDVRGVFDLDAARDKVIEAAKTILNLRAHVVRGKRTPKDLKHPFLLQVHVLSCGWAMELEAYRLRKVA